MKLKLWITRIRLNIYAINWGKYIPGKIQTVYCSDFGQINLEKVFDIGMCMGLELTAYTYEFVIKIGGFIFKFIELHLMLNFSWTLYPGDIFVEFWIPELYIPLQAFNINFISHCRHSMLTLYPAAGIQY